MNTYRKGKGIHLIHNPGRNGCWFTILSISLIFLVFGCTEQNKTQSQNPKRIFLESVREDFNNWPQRFAEDSKATFTKTDNLVALALAGTASVVMYQSNSDKELAEHFDRHQSLDGFADESLNVIGSPGTHFAATGLWYAISAENCDDFNKQRAWTMMTALSITALTTMGLKAIRDDETPNGKSWAWPSGHTASSFTAASVLDEFYGPKIGIPAYILASLLAGE
ncbi:MAG: hypothetical protein JXB29_07020 [Sedimentisphaerales bacterium]|nr:hypothetical protein [Sedimentisphaerales bacterium]